MFGRKKKKAEEVWELQSLFTTAKNRLLAMETDPETYGMSSEEEDLLADLRFTRDRMAALDPKSQKEEILTLKARIDSIDVELRALKEKSPLDAQREYVQRLADQKLAWEKEHLPKKMEKSQKWYVVLTAAGLSLPLVGEWTGRLWKHVSNRIDARDTMRKLDK